MAETGGLGTVRLSAILIVALASCERTPNSAATRPDDPGGAAGAVAIQAAALTIGCMPASNSGRDYLFCTAERSWDEAEHDCHAQGMELVRISSASENDFVRSKIADESWIGANDRGTEGAWVWTNNGEQFWTGKSNGSAVGGLYRDWASGQPDDFQATQDCASKRLVGGAHWDDRTCSTLLDYVCERMVDACPDDPDKMSPGVCGCGVPEIDANNDGVMDCAVGCTGASYQGHDYLVCTAERGWAAARADCRDVGMDLARIEDAAENDFIRGRIVSESWIGGGAKEHSTDPRNRG